MIEFILVITLLFQVITLAILLGILSLVAGVWRQGRY